MVIARIRKPPLPRGKTDPIRENFLSLHLAGQDMRESVVFQPTKNSDCSHCVHSDPTIPGIKSDIDIGDILGVLTMNFLLVLLSSFLTQGGAGSLALLGTIIGALFVGTLMNSRWRRN